MLAAGGTGGHVFPAEAVAEECLRLGHRVILITDRRFQSYGGTLGQIEKHVIRAGTLGRGLASKITAVADICIGLYQARGLLKTIKPDAVIGFGGYPSFPTVRAACMQGIPAIIHEQNSVLGRANRMLAAHVDGVATSFKQTHKLSSSLNHKTVWVGNPVRSAIRALRDVPYAPCTEEGTIRLLITGGSQGAAVFATLIPEAVELLPSSLRSRLRIDQQARASEVDAVHAVYKKMGLEADVAPFFTDMAARLAAAHVLIGRAGASTMTELAVAGRPSILIPLPGAMDNHQFYNAKSLEEQGGTMVLEQAGLEPPHIARTLESLLLEPDRLTALARGAFGYGKPDAARDLVRLTLHRISGSSLAEYLASHSSDTTSHASLYTQEKAA